MKKPTNKSIVATMKIAALAIFGVGLFSGRAAEPMAMQLNPDFGWTPEQTLHVRQIMNVRVSPNGKQIVYVMMEPVVAAINSEFDFHTFVAYVDGGRRLELTAPERSFPNPDWSPDGNWIAVLSARSGVNNIWLMAPDGVKVRQLTESKTGVGDFKWSPDGRFIAFTAPDGQTSEEESAIREKNDAYIAGTDLKMSRLYLVCTEPDSAGKCRVQRLTGGNYTVSSFDWSPDGRSIAFQNEPAPGDDAWRKADVSVVQTDDGAVASLVHSDAAEMNPLWSPDGKWIAFIKSESPPSRLDRCRICIISPDGKKSQCLEETHDSFSASSDLVGWSADSQSIYFTEARGTVVQLGALPLNGSIKIIGQPEGVLSGVTLNASRTKFGFVFETLCKPPEGYASSSEDFKMTQITFENTNLPAVPLTKVINWESAGGLKIEGLLTYPSNFKEGKRYPLLVVAHGGPRALFLQNYVGSLSASFMPLAALAERGCLILRPNIRGSSGYGNDFRAANLGDWGGGDFQDILSGVNCLVQQGIADNHRVGLAGWSYGGYMSAWAVTHTKCFRAVSAGGLACDLISHHFTSSMPSWTSDYFGDVFKNRKAYIEHSPLFYANGAATPTLIVQGENDPLMPVSQADEFYHALREQGCPVTMVIYPRTGHFPSEPKLILDVMSRNLKWFDQYLIKPQN
jgi:dipeptidyl aminopeptidase/acylaminoacyl peptidase